MEFVSPWVLEIPLCTNQYVPVCQWESYTSRRTPSAHIRRPQSQSSKGQWKNLVSLTWVEIGRWVTMSKPNQYWSRMEMVDTVQVYTPLSKLSEAVSFDHWEWDQWSRAPAWPSRWWTPAPCRRGRPGAPRGGGPGPGAGPGRPAGARARSWPGSPAACSPPARPASAPGGPGESRERPRSPQNTWENTISIIINHVIPMDSSSSVLQSRFTLIYTKCKHTVDIFVVLPSLCPTWHLPLTCLVSSIFGI